MRRWAVGLSIAGAVALALVGILTAVLAPNQRGDLAREVAESLRCPSCVGESVADSSAPVAAAMRAVIDEQLEEGRSAGEIRAWFAERYGTEVLLDPSPLAGGWLLWLVPAVIIAAAVILIVTRRHRGRRWIPLAVTAAALAGVIAAWAVTSAAEPSGSHSPTTAEGAAPAVGVLRDAVESDSGDPQLQLALARALDDAGLLAEAEQHYAAASRLRPLDTDIAYLHATVLVRDGRPVDAVPALERILAIEPEHTPALLLLGTILWEGGVQGGEELLERFMELEPEHPAATEVRELLTEGRT
ncbi:cytochrome c-type biogenesis protein CcmH [Salinibacterium sp. SYSU T00001]|uniref:cytochrome c-type biogenesis protein CcmH n=1 Tax=Homoserinimonas sedimenticola TaxID=2986805 RepID=UPI002235A7E1|nr:cytochrome c-type biogenesis protein CcmH [Salinibacterium sedimenticola]MCW4384776.1 cytochrome c-type biogenesis protein CcmH [Salinibacterium sedimenticola]